MFVADYSFNVEFECHESDARILSVLRSFSKLTMAAIWKYTVKHAETQVYDTSICVQSLCKSYGSETQRKKWRYKKRPKFPSWDRTEHDGAGSEQTTAAGGRCGGDDEQRRDEMLQ